MNKNNEKILVIGSLNMDLVVQVKDMPHEGETILGHNMCYIPGGKGANQCCAAGRIGRSVRMLGCVGNDKFGEDLIRSLSASSANIQGIQRIKNVTTGIAMIQVNAQGNNSIIVVPGANDLCDITLVKQHDELIQKCEIILLQMEIPLDTVYHAIRCAKKWNKTVILNPAPAPDGIPDEILSQVNYLTPNETELEKLTSMPCNTIEEIAAAGRLLVKRGVSNVLVTIGARGAMLVTADGYEIVPSHKVQAVDTTAAGDTFNGAFAVALSEKMNPIDAVRFANSASSIGVTRTGAQTSIPERREVDALFISGN